MTLTTEQIEQVIDDCRKGAAMRGLFNKWIVEEMASELLRCRDRLAELSAVANREAQPVGFRYRHKDTVSWLYNDWRWPDSVEADQCQIEWLYTAPPAPVVPDAVNVLLTHIEDALPDSAWKLIDVKKWNAVSMLTCDSACRAAMLAAAPEGGK